MNVGRATGGIVRAASSAYTPGAFGVAPVRKVLFSVLIRDQLKRPSVWECAIESDPATLDDIERRACRPGTGVEIEFELAARPYIKRGVRVGDVKFLRVRSVKFDGCEPVDIGAPDVLEAANA